MKYYLICINLYKNENVDLSIIFDTEEKTFRRTPKMDLYPQIYKNVMTIPRSKLW